MEWDKNTAAAILGLILLICAQSSTGSHPSHTSTSAQIPNNTLYFGWFFSESIATSLETITNGYLQQAYQSVPAVSQFLRNLNATEPLKHFQKPLDPATGKLDPTYHVTAMYCGDKDCSSYYDKFKSVMNTEFQMTLIGVFFTNKTFGVRVLLTEVQQEMFDEGTGHVTSHATPYTDNYPGIEFIPQPLNFTPSNSKAHITLGVGPGVLAVQTGPDLLSIVEYENNSTDFGWKNSTLTNIGVLREYYSLSAENIPLAFVFYLNDKMVANATFKPYINETAAAGGGQSSFMCAPSSLLNVITLTSILFIGVNLGNL
jgi:hypothetical protein